MNENAFCPSLARKQGSAGLPPRHDLNLFGAPALSFSAASSPQLPSTPLSLSPPPKPDTVRHQTTMTKQASVKQADDPTVRRSFLSKDLVQGPAKFPKLQTVAE